MKISNLPAGDPLDGTEIVPLVQDAVTRRTTAQNIADLASVSDLSAYATVVALDAATTPTALLTSIKTVDGSGSGLDAELLDGLTSADFAQLTAGLILDAVIPSTITRDTGLTAAVAAAIAGVLAAAPGTLDTLDELAAALGDDPNFATTVAGLIGAKISASVLDANSALIAVTDDTPIALPFAPSTIMARLAAGNLVAATAPQIAALLTGTTATTLAAGNHLHTSTYAPIALVDAKGDLLVGSANDILARLGVGADAFVLTADSTAATGLKWADPGGGGGDPLPPSVAADNFDDSPLGADWVVVAPASGTQTWTQANGKLRHLSTAVSNGNAGALMLPFTALGGAWAIGSIVDIQMGAYTYGRPCVQLSVGATLASASIGLLMYPGSNGAIYSQFGTLQHPYGGGSSGAWSIFVRQDIVVRYEQIDATQITTRLSPDGGYTWQNVGVPNQNLSSLGGIMPTHVGFSVNCDAQPDTAMTSDFVRRIA